MVYERLRVLSLALSLRRVAHGTVLKRNRGVDDGMVGIVNSGRHDALLGGPFPRRLLAAL